MGKFKYAVYAARKAKKAERKHPIQDERKLPSYPHSVISQYSTRSSVGQLTLDYIRQGYRAILEDLTEIRRRKSVLEAGVLES